MRFVCEVHASTIPQKSRVETGWTDLVASNFLGHQRQRFDDLLPQLLPLLILGHGDVFDVTYQAKVMDAAILMSMWLNRENLFNHGHMVDVENVRHK